MGSCYQQHRSVLMRRTMSYEHCERHDADATNGCPTCAQEQTPKKKVWLVVYGCMHCEWFEHVVFARPPTPQEMAEYERLSGRCGGGGAFKYNGADVEEKEVVE